jgi:hypothetical protein
MPSLNFGDAPVWLQWVIMILAVTAFIAGAIRAIPPAWRFVTRFVTTVNELADLPTELGELRKFRSDTSVTLAQQNTTLATQNQKIAEIHHEVHFNNGSSVKDATVRTEEAVERVEMGVKGLYGEVDGVKAQLVELHETDADMRRDFENTHPRSTLKLPKEKS